MDKIYCLFLYRPGEILYASRDKQFIQECLCDLYFDTAYRFFYYDMMLYPNALFNPKEIAKQAWKDVKDFYATTAVILETEII